MINILLPVAGLAKRFTDCGYGLPKPLIPVTGVPMIKLAIESLLPKADPSEFRLIFVVRDVHVVNNDIINTLKHLFKEWTVEVAVVDHVTQGTLCSCLVARDLIRPDEPLVIYTPDVAFEADFDVKRDFVQAGTDGALLTFKANSPDHSYVATNEDGVAVRTAEKVVISTDALVGVYAFRTGQMFLDCADRAIADGIKVNNEFYVAPIYNLLFSAGLKVSVHRTNKMYVLGTPEDLVFYETHVARLANVNKFAICCDHSGFELKEWLRTYLDWHKIDYVDFGTYSSKDSDHYDSLKPCVEYLLGNTQVIGLAICSTGQGFNIAANKVKGVRSVVVQDAEGAGLGRRHNAANFFCLPSKSVTSEELSAIVPAILGNSFDGGRHATRIRKISNDPLFSS